MTLEHKNQSSGSIFENGHLYIIQKIYTKLSIDVWFVMMIGHYLAEKPLFENLESEGALS